jgi:hypothetical protein
MPSLKPVLSACLLLAACGETARLPPEAGFGPNPVLVVADDVGNVVWRVAPDAIARSQAQ